MNKCNRKYFLRNTMLAALGIAMLPKAIRGQAGAVAPGTAVTTGFDPSYFGIVDLHCHPSLKMYLWGRKLWRRHTAGLGVNAFDLQDDVEQLSTGSLLKEPDTSPGEQ